MSQKGIPFAYINNTKQSNLKTPNYKVMNRLLIVANRLPIKVIKEAENYSVQDSAGGLATGLSSLSESLQMEWVGWPGLSSDDAEVRSSIHEKLESKYHPVFMNADEEKNFYQGFSNETIWPLFHCFTEFVHYNKLFWDSYRKINERFCDKVLEVVQKGDIIWVQDYHLMLLPKLLKDRLPENPIGFFLHIPFPSYELFRTLPWRKEILQGLLGADLIGFHTYEYMRHFYSSVYRILGFDLQVGEIKSETNTSYIDSFPMGINFDKFNKSVQDQQVIEQIEQFKGKFGDFQLILSVDRLDYTKGIIHRLKAFDALLTKHPELQEKVSLIMVTVPSRFSVEQYKNLKEQIDELVGNLNGKYASLSWTPVHYFYRSVQFEQLTALYGMCDVGLVTPLRDGMNLVAKEYVASKTDEKGVLILSELAGSAVELDGALMVNPNNEEEIVDTLYQALHMPEVEQKMRIKKMQKIIKNNSVEKWAKSFIDQLNTIVESKKLRSKNIINGHETRLFSGKFQEAKNPLIILDYDGTLVPFNVDPAKAEPHPEIIDILDKLSDQAKVIIVSGRDCDSLQGWFKNSKVDLIGEHGMWNRRNNNWSKEIEIDTSWKDEVISIMEDFSSKTPGSFIEHKSCSLAFHYRKTDNFLAEMRLPQLINALTVTCVKFQLELLQGNKVLEIRVIGVNKGTSIKKYIDSEYYDFIMAIGDDKTDEDMFEMLPDSAISIKVGDAETVARYRVENIRKVKELLKHLSDIKREKQNSKLKEAIS